jgi:hypothetical protein
MRARVAALAGPAAAVALLIAHRAWLQRTDLRTRFTFTGTDHDTEITSAGIDGAAAITVLARALACSGSEAASHGPRGPWGTGGVGGRSDCSTSRQGGSRSTCATP